MEPRDPHLLVQTAPFVKQPMTTTGLMFDVLLALLLPVLCAVWFFGVSALLILAASTAGALLPEWLANRGRRGPSTLRDGSALLTGVLLALTLPPGFPLWMAFLGGVVGVGLGKLAFGGLGHNLFNPALVGRAFLQAAFPTAITTWAAQGGLAQFAEVRGANLALPMLQGPADVVTTATPLGLFKFDGQGTPLGALLAGDTAGSLGETCAIAIALAGLYMIVRRTCDWRLPVSVLVGAALFSAVLWGIDAEKYPAPWFTLCSGGLLFGAVYMATDPVTSPLAPRGAWIFGLGVGVLVVLIRVWGGLPEGVMYAILLMNAATPLIERAVQPRTFGHGRAERMAT